MQMAQRQSAKHRADRLHAATEDFFHLFTVPFLQTHVDTPIGPHAQAYPETFCNGIVLEETFSSGQRPRGMAKSITWANHAESLYCQRCNPSNISTMPRGARNEEYSRSLRRLHRRDLTQGA